MTDYECSECGYMYDFREDHNCIQNMEWTWAMTTSEVRSFSGGDPLNKKEWQEGLNKKLLNKRNKELTQACKVFKWWKL